MTFTDVYCVGFCNMMVNVFNLLDKIIPSWELGISAYLIYFEGKKAFLNTSLNYSLEGNLKNFLPTVHHCLIHIIIIYIENNYFYEMYEKVTDSLDQATFFEFARELVHIDGAFVTEEQAVMLRVNQYHLCNVDVDQLVGQIRLDLADEEECHEFKPTVYFCRREFLLGSFEKKACSPIMMKEISNLSIEKTYDEINSNKL